jgi:hypothetical protein
MNAWGLVVESKRRPRVSQSVKEDLRNLGQEIEKLLIEMHAEYLLDQAPEGLRRERTKKTLAPLPEDQPITKMLEWEELSDLIVQGAAKVVQEEVQKEMRTIKEVLQFCNKAAYPQILTYEVPLDMGPRRWDSKHCQNPRWATPHQ